MKIVKYHTGNGKPIESAHISDTIYRFTHPTAQIVDENGRVTDRVRLVLYPAIPHDDDQAVVTPADCTLCSFIRVFRSELEVLEIIYYI